MRVGLGSACAGAKQGHISKSVKQSSGNPEAPELTTHMNFHTSDPPWAPLLIICGLLFPMVPLIWQKSMPDSQFTDFYCLHSTFGPKLSLGNATESVKYTNLWCIHWYEYPLKFISIFRLFYICCKLLRCVSFWRLTFVSHIHIHFRKACQTLRILPSNLIWLDTGVSSLVQQPDHMKCVSIARCVFIMKFIHENLFLRVYDTHCKPLG